MIDSIKADQPCVVVATDLIRRPIFHTHTWSDHKKKLLIRANSQKKTNKKSTTNYHLTPSGTGDCDCL